MSVERSSAVSYRFVAVAVAVAGVCGALAPGAWTAPPPQSTPLEVVLTGRARPRRHTDRLQQPGEVAAVHLTTGGKYIFMEAFPTGDPENPFFTTPGFDDNNLALVTCNMVEPVTGVTRARVDHARAIAPTKPPRRPRASLYRTPPSPVSTLVASPYPRRVQVGVHAGASLCATTPLCARGCMACKRVQIGLTGFEPATSPTRTERATKLRHSPKGRRLALPY